MPELTEEQVAALNQIGGLTAHLWQRDPEFKRQYQQAAKKALPHLSVPEVEAAAAAEAAVKPHVEEVQKLRGELAERDIKDRTEREWQAVYRKGLVSEEERPEVEKMMTERLIGDIGTAAEFHAQGKRLAVPRSTPTRLTMPTGPNFKGLLRNPDGWARDEAYKAVAEIEANRERG